MNHTPRSTPATDSGQSACCAGRFHQEVIRPSAPRGVVRAPHPRPRTWPRNILVSIVLTVSPAISSADLGPNAGGTLVVYDTGIVGSVGPGGPVFTPLPDCAGADAEAAVGVDCTWVVYAAFPAGGSPRLGGLSFQERFESSALVITGGGVVDSSATRLTGYDGWPTADEGIASVDFSPAQTATLIPICWFSGEAAASGAVFRITANPDAYPAFRDDSSPPHEDPILGFGTLGFGTAGSNRCPGGLGACCRCDGACFVITEAECTALRGGGIWFADYGCDPNPCALVSSEAGACCLPDETCRVYTGCECALSQGVYKGDYTLCGSTICLTPVQEATWGWIKNRYR